MLSKKLAVQLALPLALSVGLTACDDPVQMDIPELANQPYREFYDTVMDPSTICSDITVAKSTGGVIKGTRDCKLPDNICTEPGKTGCYLIDPSLYGLSPDDLKPGNFRKDVKIADVTGDLIANDNLCTEDGAQGCVATTQYPSVTKASARAKVAVGQDILGLPGEFVPDFPDAANVLSSAKTGGTQGQLPLCSVAVTSNCVLTPAYRAVPPAALVPTDIKQNTIIGAVTGSFVSGAPDCSAANATGCVTTARYAAVQKSRVVANNLLTGYDLLGVNGSVQPQPSACSSDSQVGCLATAPFKSIKKIDLNPGIIKKNVTIAGITGDYPSASHPLAGHDAGISDLTSATFNAKLAAAASFEFFDATGARHLRQGTTNLAANRIIAGTSIFGVAGNLTTRPANCSTDGGDACVTHAGFPAIKQSSVTAGILRKGVKLAGVTGTYPSLATPLAADTAMADLSFPGDLDSASQVEFFDAAGTRHAIAGSALLTPSNILENVTLFGVAGSAKAKPSLCSSQGAEGCVATAGYPAFHKADLTADVLKRGTVISGVTGTFPSTTSRLIGASGTTDLTDTGLATAVRSAGNVEFWDATGLRHTVSGDTDLTAANILTGVRIFGVDGSLVKQPLDCTGLKLEDCLTTADYPSYDPGVLTEDKIKKDVTIGKVTGKYPSAAYKLTGEQPAVTDLTATNFNARMASSQSFEYFDSAGNRFSAVGDADLLGANIRQGTNILGVAGAAIETSGDCTAENGEGCVATANYPSYQKSRLSAANIKFGEVVLGVTGTYPSASNPLNGATAAKDLTATNFDSSMSDTTSFEFWTSAGVHQTASGDADLIQANIRQGTTIYGVAGNIADTPADCSGGNATNCVATATYPAVDKSTITPAVLKRGVARMGVTGDYPSATYPLHGNTATADLNTATFVAKVRSADSFEFFDSAGNVHTASGDADIVASNIGTGTNIFGVAGTFVGLSNDSEWDLRHGVSVGSITGKVKTNCRNLADFNYYGGPGNDYVSIDDQNTQDGATYPSDNPWSTADDVCGPEIWKDVSYNTATGQHTTCVAGSADVVCMHKDQISGLTWREAKVGNTGHTWSDAVSYCNNLTDAGYTDWRLPTMKEVMAAGVHGMHRLKTIFNTPGDENAQTYRTNYPNWTSTARSTDTSQKILVYMALSQLSTKPDGDGHIAHAHCVR